MNIIKQPIYLVTGTGLPCAAQTNAVSWPSCLPIVRLKSSDDSAGDFAPTGSGNFLAPIRQMCLII